MEAALDIELGHGKARTKAYIAKFNNRVKANGPVKHQESGNGRTKCGRIVLWNTKVDNESPTCLTCTGENKPWRK